MIPPFTLSTKPSQTDHNNHENAKLSLAAPFGLALVTGSSLHAQTAWDGSGGSSDYSNNLNWATYIIPGNGNANGALIGNGSTQTVIYSTATSYTSIGTAAANSLRVGTGTNGVGSLPLSGGGAGRPGRPQKKSRPLKIILSKYPTSPSLFPPASAGGILTH